MSLPTPPLAEEAEKRSLFTTLLRPFGTVESGEVATAALMTLTVFLLLTAYYILKTAREPLILLQQGAEVKAYASAGQALLLIPIIGGYAALAKRLGRIKLLASVYLFFLSNLILFAVAVAAGLKIGILFYLWVGIFSVTVIAQFWSFANDIYTPDQGKRLFAILGIGSSVGAVAGAAVAHSIGHWGSTALMVTASGLLVVCVALFIVVDRREGAKSAVGKRPHEEPLKADKVFRTLAKDRYLLLIAALTLVLNWVNNNGEYLVDRTLLVAANEQADALHMTHAIFINQFKSGYFFYYNVGGVALQLFAVSRIMKLVGVRGALYVLPVISFTGYVAVALFPTLRVVEMTKVAENSVDYSLQNTARQALFLVTDRAGKYIGKTIIDTFMMRAGDVLAALTVALGTRLALGTRAFALFNLALVVLWAGTLLFLGREHEKRSADMDAQGTATESA